MNNRKLRFENMEEKTLLTTLLVENGLDSGEGSFREAVLAANDDSSIHQIEFQPDVNKVKLESTIAYSGSQSLQIVGADAVVRPASNDLNGQFNLLESTGGADLELRNIKFSNGLTGVFVPVPKSATGTLDVTLKGVTIRDNSHFGIHIDDQKATEVDYDIWHEFFDDDFSDNKNEPTILNYGMGLLPGLHRVHGTSTAGEIEDFDEMGPFYPELDIDTFTVVIEAGTQLDAINLNHYSWTNPHGHTGGEGGVPGGGAFFAVQKGDVIFQNGDPSELLGAGLIGVIPGSEQGDNILDDLGSGTFSNTGVPTFEGPLGPGTYTFWYQEGPTDTEYTLEFVVSDIAGKNSDAGINFVMKDSVIQINGNGATEADGIRIDEGGAGNLRFRSLNSVVKSNGGDGVELDESGKGSAFAYIHSSTFEKNGDASENDPEDGIDIDESGSGNVWLKALDSYFNSNSDEGIDLDEEGGGVLTADLMAVEANNNGDLGIALSEEGSGNLVAQIIALNASNNQDDGVRIDESGGGDNRTKFNNVITDKNGEDGVHVTEENGGNLNFNAHQLTSYKNSLCGVSLEETGSGNINSVVHDFDANANGQADDEEDGYGLLIVESNHGSLALEIYDPTIDKIKSAEGIYLQENHAGNIDATLREFNINKFDDDGIEIDEHGPGNLTVDASGMNMSKLNDGIDLWETHGGNLAFRGDQITFEKCSEGIELEEDGSGNLSAEISNTRIENSYEAFEIEEEGSGNISVKLSNVIVDQTVGDGLEIIEDSEGDIYLEVHNSQFLNSKDDGIYVEEEGNGNLTAKLFNVLTSAKNEGVDLEEYDAGDLMLESWMLRASGGEMGISLTETSKGDLKASLIETTVTGSSGDGLYVYEEHKGNLELKVVTMDLTNCGGDAISASENGKGDFSAEFTSGRLQADEYGLSLEEHDGGQGVARAFGVDLEGDLDDYWVENVELTIG